eukprot:TRINITY_DN2678_c0_g1_i6.p1 TRINITY_DN2678_c0_g1~~TRINITY_DN2678_c0_g1_i6.p1  ORF type:complete len:380 (+),score=35.66 TRINITY_DN2678_c0_g1_i6:440-1579(+)
MDKIAKARLAAMQKQKLEEELMRCKAKPDILNTSSMIARSIERAPVHMRADSIIKRKEYKLERLRREQELERAEKENQELTFHPIINEIPGLVSGDVVSRLSDWEQKRNESMMQSRYDYLTKEKEVVTFRPQLNRESQLILHEKGNMMYPVEQRLLKQHEQHLKQMSTAREKSLPSFKPKICKKTILKGSKSKFLNDISMTSHRSGKSGEITPIAMAKDLLYVPMNEEEGRSPRPSKSQPPPPKMGKSGAMMSRPQANDKQAIARRPQRSMQNQPQASFALKPATMYKNKTNNSIVIDFTANGGDGPGIGKVLDFSFDEGETYQASDNSMMTWKNSVQSKNFGLSTRDNSRYFNQSHSVINDVEYTPELDEIINQIKKR